MESRWSPWGAGILNSLSRKLGTNRFQRGWERRRRSHLFEAALQRSSGEVNAAFKSSMLCRWPRVIACVRSLDIWSKILLMASMTSGELLPFQWFLVFPPSLKWRKWITWGFTISIVVFFHFLKFYWQIVDVQYCDDFCCTTKWFNYTYTHTCSFQILSPSRPTSDYWIEFSVLYSRSLLASHSIYLTVHMPIANPQSIPPPTSFPL